MLAVTRRWSDEKYSFTNAERLSALEESLLVEFMHKINFVYNSRNKKSNTTLKYNLSFDQTILGLK